MKNVSFKQFMEMPVANAQLLGKGWNQFPVGKTSSHNWDKASYNILTNNGLQRITNQWSKTEHKFDLYFVKQQGLGETAFKGKISEDILKKYQINIPINHSNITVLFTNNKGGDRVPLTPWMAAHRFGHVALFVNPRTFEFITNEFNKHVNELLAIQYGTSLSRSSDVKKNEILKKAIFTSIGTMRSAVHNNLSNQREFLFEMFSQYLITGKVTFKERLPRVIPLKKVYNNVVSGLYSQIENDELALEQVKDYLEYIGNQMKLEFQRILDACVGEIFMV